ncbi:AAA family ATPase [Marivita hallyeonensis]|uniref:AAA ATPase domain-containing protein n=1 Tax=Marivita hallyeonensis TaxID=996342 RepID=A0A1M5Y8I8_9RHOB|nr:AAA family ATPase [Marivita hallyeonensis]SHI08395.1 AAA ATPase domain-containing protein [Marivita hallyeonensis]
MKLKSFQVREFRSVWDSGLIEIDDKQTCLVGKNEAGKTALLTALYRTNPIIFDDAVFDETYDYPKREVEDYRFDVENGDRDEAIVVTCHYALEDDDLERVTDVFGKKILKTNTFRRDTYYGKRNSRFILSVDEGAARKHLATDPNLPDPLADTLRAASDWESFSAGLAEAEQTEAVTGLKALVAKIQEKGLASYVFNSLIWPHAPKYLYFDEYYQMQGMENLNALIQREEAGNLRESDHPLLGLINLARLDHRELVTTKTTAELKNKLQGAGNHLTRRIIKYWSQNQHIQMLFDVRDAKPEDPEGMREGINIWGEVYDNVHWASTPLSSRSRGFVWFFSFLAWYEDIKRQKQNVVLLLDEPGMSLHGRAQGDLLQYFKEELTKHQLIYSTHSPFMVDSNHFDRVRIVQDRGIDAKEPLPKEEDGTKVLTNVFDATDDSLFPLQGALGYEIQQTLFIGPNSLIVEGPADLLFLTTVSSELEREGRIGLSDKWVITPVGGCGKVPTFVALLAPQKGMNLATLLDIEEKDRPQIEDLYKKKLLKKKNVLTYADFLDQDTGDVEDMFDRDFYVNLVNQEFGQQLKAPIDPGALNDKKPRVLKAIDEHLEKQPLKSGSFSHYRPARYLSEHIGDLWESMSDEAKGRFEEAFKALNDLLK